MESVDEVLECLDVAAANGGLSSAQRFAAWLRLARRKAAMSRQDIVNAGGPSMSTLKAWEGGRVETPRRSQIVALAGALGLPAEHVLGVWSSLVSTETVRVEL